MVCVETVQEGLVQHMVQVTIWTLALLKFLWSVSLLGKIQKHPTNLSFLLFSCSTTMQYVIYTYMKHLGVRVKEPRSLESKRVRINFLPKIKVLNFNFCTLALLSLLPLHHLPDTCLVLIKKNTEKHQDRKGRRREGEKTQISQHPWTSASTQPH